MDGVAVSNMTSSHMFDHYIFGYLLPNVAHFLRVDETSPMTKRQLLLLCLS